MCRHAGCLAGCMPGGPQVVSKKLITSSHPLPLPTALRGFINCLVQYWLRSDCWWHTSPTPGPRLREGRRPDGSSCDDGELVDCGVPALEFPLGPVGLWRQLVQLDVQDRPEFSELGFRQRYPVGVQFAAADGHRLRTSLVDRCRVLPSIRGRTRHFDKRWRRCRRECVDFVCDGPPNGPSGVAALADRDGRKNMRRLWQINLLAPKRSHVSSLLVS